MQKFFRGHRVKIAKTLPSDMYNFEKNCEAIVQHSFTDVYVGDDFQDEIYSLLLLVGAEETWRTGGWYPKQYLTLVNRDRDNGERILQEHKRIARILEKEKE